MNRSRCLYGGVCSGCSCIGMPVVNQIEHKREILMTHLDMVAASKALTEPVQIIRPAEFHYRQHADMTLHRIHGQRRIGLYDQAKKEIIDIAECPLMSAELREWYQKVREMLPSIQFGHFRVRVAPDGKRGIWLDFPNRVLAWFLEEERFFKRLCLDALVQIGQQHTQIGNRSGSLIHQDTELYPWSETYTGKNLKPRPLFSHVGAFSQAMNKELMKLVHDAVGSCLELKSWIELGAGCGNFTLYLASLQKPVTAVEMYPLALCGMKKSLEVSGLLSWVEIIKANFHQPNKTLMNVFQSANAGFGMLMDPPRSGMGAAFFTSIPDNSLPGAIVYLSCFAPSLARDAATLLKRGYQITSFKGLDQFPHSPHCEWVVVFRR